MLSIDFSLLPGIALVLSIWLQPDTFLHLIYNINKLYKYIF